MVDTDDTCPSTHTLRCTLARNHDGPHTAFRTRVSWTGDVDATDRLREQYGRCDECAHLFSPSELDAERGDPTWGHTCFGSFKGNRRKPGTARCESYRVPMVECSPLRSTPQEGTTDDVTRIGELAIQPAPQHAPTKGEG